MVRQFISDAQRKAVMSSISRGKDRIRKVRPFRLRKMWKVGDTVTLSTEEPLCAHMFKMESRIDLGEYHRLGTDLGGLKAEIVSMHAPSRRATIRLLEGYGREGFYVRDFPISWIQPPAWYHDLTADQMQAMIDYQRKI